MEGLNTEGSRDLSGSGQVESAKIVNLHRALLRNAVDLGSHTDQVQERGGDQDVARRRVADEEVFVLLDLNATQEGQVELHHRAFFGEFDVQGDGCG